MEQLDFILASASPRRRELLDDLGISFRIIVSDADETVENAETAADFVTQVASKKGEAVLKSLENEGKLLKNTVILACDTVVVYDNMIIGKPENEMHARLTLSMLSDSWHAVFSGLWVYCGGKIVTEAVRTDVKFREISDEEVNSYVASGEPFGKAGSYAIQGKAASFVTRIEGEYANVVGLPVAALVEILSRDFGILPTDYISYEGKR